jgi:DNA/RNA endonuclease G (NUC1)
MRFFLKLFLSPILFIVLTSYHEDNCVLLEHQYYESIFDKSEHIPILVAYVLRNEMFDCDDPIIRYHRFVPDPDLPYETSLEKDYKYSNYDRGHLMSFADNRCNEDGANECFYYSNVFPQPHNINAGIWERLEHHERLEAQNDDLIVYVGSIGIQDKIGEDSVVVPKICWKVIYSVYSDKYEVPNTYVPYDSDYTDYQVSLENFEQEQGIKFRDGEIYSADTTAADH